MQTNQRWTQTEITELRARAAAGETAETIAKALGREPWEIFAMTERLRLRVG